MNALLDNFLVGIVLLASLSYAFYKLGPRNLRKGILKHLSRIVDVAPAFLKLKGLSRNLDSAAAGKTQGACGGCDNCGDASTAPKSAADIHIPVAKIGRRA
jgi:hypothetical protein